MKGGSRVSKSGEAAAIVQAAGVPPAPEATALVDAYLRRKRRGWHFGVVLGLVAAFGPLAGEHGRSLLLPRLFAGYLLGLLVSELIVKAPQRSQLRAASLRPRSRDDLLPPIGQLLPWLTLVPVLAAPLLAVGWHPRGTTRTHDGHGNSCLGVAYWPHTATLFAVAGLAGFALVATMLILRRLVRRALPAEDPTVLALDRSLRARSARSAVAAATALGVLLMSYIAAAVDDGSHAYVCYRPLPVHHVGLGNVYSWAPTVSSWLNQLAFALLLSALPVWILCQKLSVPRDRPPGSDA
jgi:hypothetical protein